MLSVCRQEVPVVQEARVSSGVEQAAVAEFNTRVQESRDSAIGEPKESAEFEQKVHTNVPDSSKVVQRMRKEVVIEKVETSWLEGWSAEELQKQQFEDLNLAKVL